jgi:hypothetical protein
MTDRTFYTIGFECLTPGILARLETVGHAAFDKLQQAEVLDSMFRRRKAFAFWQYAEGRPDPLIPASSKVA